MIKHIETKVLDWIYRLVCLYTYGEDNIDKNLKLILNRCRVDRINNGKAWHIYNSYQKYKELDSVYETSLSVEESFSYVRDSFSTVKAKKLVVIVVESEKNDKGESVVDPCIYFEDKNNIIIFIEKEVLEVKDLTRTVRALYELAMDVTHNLLKGDIKMTSNEYRNGLADFRILIAATFVKSTINDLHLQDHFVPGILLRVCEKYIDDVADVSHINDIMGYIDELIDKLENGDYTLWSRLSEIFMEERGENVK